MPSVIPYDWYTFSGPTRSIQRCTNDGEITAAPCRNHTRLDRSRCSMSGRSAMRCSMSVVAVKVVMPCASMRSTMRAASNFCSTTRWSPASRLNSVANPLVWYIGAITSTTCGRSTGAHVVANGMPVISSKIPGLSMRMTLTAPVDPLLQIPLVIGDTAGGNGVGSRSWVDSNHARSSTPTLTPSITSSTRSRSQSGRSHRTGTGTAPSFHAASTVITNSGELRRATATRPPSVAPRSCSARAICVERRCSSGHVTTVSAPSTRDDAQDWRGGVVLGELRDAFREGEGAHCGVITRRAKRHAPSSSTTVASYFPTPTTANGASASGRRVRR